MSQTYLTELEQVPQGHTVIQTIEKEEDPIIEEQPIEEKVIEAIPMPAGLPEKEKPKLSYPVFDFTLQDIGLLKRIVNAAGKMTAEITLEISDYGLSSRFMDPGHNVLFDLSLSKFDFLYWKCFNPGKFTVRVKDLSDRLNRNGKVGTVRISSDNPSTLKIELGMPAKYYELQTVESKESSTPIPKLSFDSVFQINRADFEEVLMDAAVTSGHIKITSNYSTVVFSNKGDSGKFEKELDRQSGLISLSCREKVESCYSIEFFQNILKPLKPENLTIEYRSKFPARVTYRPYGGQSFLSYYIAPRVTE